MDVLHVVIECFTEGDGRRMAELSKRRSLAVKRRLVRLLRDDGVAGGQKSAEENFWRKTLLARGYVRAHAVSDTGRRQGVRPPSPHPAHPEPVSSCAEPPSNAAARSLHLFGCAGGGHASSRP